MSPLLHVSLHSSLDSLERPTLQQHHFVTSAIWRFPMLGPERPLSEGEMGGGPPPDEDSASVSNSGLKKPERVRSEFPETWLWLDTSIGYS